MDKEGVHIDGTLVFEASLMPQLYKEGANQLYFGSLRGEHPYATYKSVELVTEGGSTGGGTTTPGETATYEITDNAMTMYVPSNNGEDVQNYTQYMKDAKLQVEKDAEGKYTVTFNDVVAGKDRESLGNIVFEVLMHRLSQKTSSALRFRRVVFAQSMQKVLLSTTTCSV